MSRYETGGSDSGKYKLRVSEESRGTEKFECAVRKRSMRCGYCGWPITKHAVKRDGGCYCSVYCAGQAEEFLRLAEETHWSTVAVKLYQSEALLRAGH